VAAVFGVVVTTQGPTAHAADSDFVAGSGSAAASVIQLGPKASGLALTQLLGESLSGYIGTAAQASSQTLDMGLLGTLLTAAHCDGSPSFLKPDQIPTATHVDSRDPSADQGKARAYAGTPNGTPVLVQAGREQAWAYKDPRGKATTTLALASLPGVINAQGGVAQTETGIVDGATRMAKASVELGDMDLFGGLIKLSHLQWSAVQQTGKDPKAQGTFSIGSATIGGVPLPTSTPGATLAALNQVTSQIGVTFQSPAMTQANGVVTIGPLVMQMQSSPTEQKVISPALVALQPARQAVITALTRITCYIQTVVTVADVSVGPLTGSGSFDLGFGGAAATTEGQHFDNPFAGGLGGGADVLGTGLQAPTAGAAPGALGLSGTSFVPGTPGLAATPPASRRVRRGESAGGILAGARSLPGHTGGWAILVGFLAVAGVVGVAGADWFRLRRASPGGEQ
jgi:hypothetical protein